MNWKEYWNDQSTPLHGHNSEEWYENYAKEINLICKSLAVKPGDILDSGCGNGALFPYYDFVAGEYVGVDFSTKLLAIFKENHPQVTLVDANAATYVDNNSYSLIFSNGVVQYFDSEMLDRYIRNCLNMLEEDGGVLLLGNIPNSLLRLKYGSGEVHATIRRHSWLRKNLITLRYALSKDGLGDWYKPLDFEKYQDENHEVVVFGSLFHPYRFSVAIKKIRNDA